MSGAKTRRWGVLAIAVAALTVFALLVFQWWSAPGNTAAAPSTASGAGPRYRIQYAQLKFTSGALVHYAEEQGFLDRRGIEFQSVVFPAGPDVLTNLQSRSNASIAGTVAVTPVANRVLAGDEPVIIAQIFESDSQAQLVTFADTGISRDATSLKGKRVGLTRNTIADVYLAKLLASGGLSRSDIIVVAGKPGDNKRLLLSGELDALVIWDPFIVQIGREYEAGLEDGRLSDRGPVVVIDDPSLYTSHVVIATTRDHIRRQRGHLVQLLQGLKDASEAFRSNPEEAQRITEVWLGVEPGDLNAVFRDSSYRLSLPVDRLQSALRQEIDIIVSEGLAEGAAPADLSPFVDGSLLNEVDPNLVDD